MGVIADGERDIRVAFSAVDARADRGPLRRDGRPPPRNCWRNGGEIAAGAMGEIGPLARFPLAARRPRGDAASLPHAHHLHAIGLNRRAGRLLDDVLPTVRNRGPRPVEIEEPQRPIDRRPVELIDHAILAVGLKDLNGVGHHAVGLQDDLDLLEVGRLLLRPRIGLQPDLALGARRRDDPQEVGAA